MPNYIPIQDLTIKSSITDTDYVPVSDGSTTYAVHADKFKTYSSQAAEAAAAAAQATAAELESMVETNNLFEMENQTVQSVAITSLGNGYIKINGTPTANVSVPIVTLSAGTYSASITFISGTASTLTGVSVYESTRWVYANTPVVKGRSISGNTQVSLTLTSGVTFSNFVVFITIVKGSDFPMISDYGETVVDGLARELATMAGDDVATLRATVGERERTLVDGSTTFAEGFCLDSDGIYWYGAGWTLTDFIECTPGATLTFKVAGFNRPNKTLASFAFFDASKVLVSVASKPTQDTVYYWEGSVTVPARVRYVRVLGNSSYLANPFVKQEGYGIAVGQLRPSVKVAFVGDSLTQGMTGGTSPTFTFAEKPYPVIFKEFLNSCGYEVTIKNFGRRGLSAVTYWNNAIPVGSSYHSPDAGEPGDTIDFDSSLDAVIIMLGTNGHLDENTIDEDTAIEAGETYLDYADTNCGDYCKIIEYIMENTSNHAQIILVSPVYACANGYRNKVINTLPTIKALGERYQIPVINAVYESGIGWFNQAAFYNQSDLVHLNQAGYHKFGTFIASQFLSLFSTFDMSEIPT